MGRWSPPQGYRAGCYGAAMLIPRGYWPKRSPKISKHRIPYTSEPSRTATGSVDAVYGDTTGSRRDLRTHHIVAQEQNAVLESFSIFRRVTTRKGREICGVGCSRWSDRARCRRRRSPHACTGTRYISNASGTGTMPLQDILVQIGAIT